MNKIYQRIWSKVRQGWILVNKKVASRGCPSKIVGAIILTAFLSFSGTSFSLDPGALPTGGKITSGFGSIFQIGRQMTVNQSTDKMIATWDTFDIGRKAGVTFQQPDKNSVALNKIYDQNPSQILGTLSANGKIFLINPSGIVFGSGAQVNVGGLVASSLKMADSDFLAGHYTFLNDGNAGSVINKGGITAVNGGVVALIAPKVVNEGTITANGGSVLLGAGNQVSLDFTGDGLISYTIDQGAVDALAENSGLIKADGGMVVMTARAADALTSSVVNNSGVIEAQTLENKGGQILLLSDPVVGRTIVSGTLDASALQGGNGGFIETSAKDVKVNDGTVITTSAPMGKTGTWLIDPTNFTIAASSGDITGAQLGTNLSGGNVIIATSVAGAEDGHINVNDDIAWSQNTLSLQAHGDININAVLTANNTAALDMKAGYDGFTYNGTNTIKVGFKPDGTFSGRVDFFQADGVTPRSGNDFLTINGNGYTVIANLDSLQDIQNNLSGYYALGSNIDASPTSTWNSRAGFNPLGDNTAAFTGQFDGLGHTINNLTIDRIDNDYVGLFGYTNGAALRNVGIINANITGRMYVGALVSYNDPANIVNTYSSGTVTAIGADNSVYAGGLVGYNYGNITNSHSSATVTGTGGYVFNLSGDANSWGGYVYTGGLVGFMNDGNMTDSHSTGPVTGTSNNAYDESDNFWSANAGYVNAGGLVGFMNNGNITDSYSTGPVTGTGGNAYALHDISLDSNGGGVNAGGLVGHMNNVNITDSYSTGPVTGTGGNAYNASDSSERACGGIVIAGGLVGFMSNSNIIDSYSTGAVTGILGSAYNTRDNSQAGDGDVFLGGLVGHSWVSSITDSYATGKVEGMGFRIKGIRNGSEEHQSNSVTGGLIGNTSENTIITDSYATGRVKGGIDVGGLVGYTGVNTVIMGSYATGRVTGKIDVGGLVGLSSENTIITDSFATGRVKGGNDVGGLIGHTDGNMIITDSFATGRVKGKIDVGGLVGHTAENTVISRSFATGGVKGSDNIGGLIGYADENMIITDSFAAGTVKGKIDVGGLIGHNNFSSVDKSYATGRVKGNIYVGGLIGYGESCIVTNSFWDTQTTGQTTSAAGTGLTTAEMKTLSYFTDAGWDINNTGAATDIWAINDGVTYPWLTGYSY